jgi:hypothetical protein
MNEQFDILIATARSYTSLANSLKKKSISYKHYVTSAKKCVEMAKNIRHNIKELDNMLKFKIKELEVTEIIKAA